MELLHWVGGHGFDLLEAAAIIASLSFTAFALRMDARTRRVTNLLALTAQHRDIWSHLYARPELARVLEPAPDLVARPVTVEEEMFVTFLLLHLSTTHRAMREGTFGTQQRLEEDIRAFFVLPIPREVWNRIRPLHEADFVAFVERAMRG